MCHGLALLAQSLVVRVLCVCVEFCNVGRGEIRGVAALFAKELAALGGSEVEF